MYRRASFWWRLRRVLQISLLIGAVTSSGLAAAQSGPPTRIPSPGGEVVIADARQKRAYDQLHYAPSRRAGDFVYFSGVVVRRQAEEGRDVEAFRAQTRRTFAQLDSLLRAADLTFGDVVMLNTFHVWNGQISKEARRRSSEPSRR